MKREPKPLEPIDHERATAAVAKQRRGEEPTREEKRALQKLKDWDEEQRRLKYYGTVPKRHYLRLSGRPAKVVIEQADRYGFPLRGETAALPAVRNTAQPAGKLALNSHPRRHRTGRLPGLPGRLDLVGKAAAPDAGDRIATTTPPGSLSLLIIPSSFAIKDLRHLVCGVPSR